MALIAGLGRSSGGGYSKLLQYSCLEIPMDRGAWPGYSPQVAEPDTTEAPEHSTAISER